MLWESTTGISNPVGWMTVRPDLWGSLEFNFSRNVPVPFRVTNALFETIYMLLTTVLSFGIGKKIQCKSLNGYIPSFRASRSVVEEDRQQSEQDESNKYKSSSASQRNNNRLSLEKAKGRKDLRSFWRQYA